jgi:hypothetical protein
VLLLPGIESQANAEVPLPGSTQRAEQLTERRLSTRAARWNPASLPLARG